MDRFPFEKWMKYILIDLENEGMVDAIWHDYIYGFRIRSHAPNALYLLVWLMNDDIWKVGKVYYFKTIPTAKTICNHLRQLRSILVKRADIIMLSHLDRE